MVDKFNIVKIKFGI